MLVSWYNIMQQEASRCLYQPRRGQPMVDVVMSILPQKMCRDCGVSKPLANFSKDKSRNDGYRRICKACDSARNKAWRIENVEHCVVTAHQRHEANKERDSARGRRWYEQHRDLTIARAREWGLSNTDKVRAVKQESAWRLADRRRASRQAWKRRNPMNAFIHKHIRRARKRANGGSFTEQEWLTLCAQYDNRCLCCGRDDVKLTADHVVPLEHGGSSYISNIQPLCGRCNSAKGTKTIDYRRAEAEGLECERIQQDA
jgi:5-methylcytosine-specific restriction endonuclease McrA